MKKAPIPFFFKKKILECLQKEYFKKNLRVIQ